MECEIWTSTDIGMSVRVKFARKEISEHFANFRNCEESMISEYCRFLLSILSGESEYDLLFWNGKDGAIAHVNFGQTCNSIDDLREIILIYNFLRKVDMRDELEYTENQYFALEYLGPKTYMEKVLFTYLNESKNYVGHEKVVREILRREYHEVYPAPTYNINMSHIDCCVKLSCELKKKLYRSQKF